MILLIVLDHLSLSLSLSRSLSQEASSSFEQWEKLMSSQSENQFVEVMSLITHMYKQTAIAKVLYAREKCVYCVIVHLKPGPITCPILKFTLNETSRMFL